MSSMTPIPPAIPSAAWWRHGYVWLLISGPAAVVVAGLVTAWIAATRPDPVVTDGYYRQRLDIQAQQARERALMPAQQARNHAATPARPAAP